MKGYKGMSKDMTCQGMKFEIGKTYHVDGDIIICKNGLHFCEKLIDVLYFYEKNGSNRFFEVWADGEIKTDGTKSVASSLTIIREINDVELNRTIYDPGYGYGTGYDYAIIIYDTDDSSEYDYGNIYDQCYGYGDINGNGYGGGLDYGYSDGNGQGYGDGHGNGNGKDYGYGDGYGQGNGDGHGNGNDYELDYIKNIIKYV